MRTFGNHLRKSNTVTVNFYLLCVFNITICERKRQIGYIFTKRDLIYLELLKTFLREQKATKQFML